MADSPHPVQRPSRYRRVRWWLARLLLATAATLLALKAGDATLGWTSGIATRHRLRLSPHVSIRHHSTEFDYEYRTNSLGLRGQEYPRARSPDTWRIAVVGDSLVAGYGVAEADLLTTRLKQRLTESLRRAGDPRNVEVINVGRSGSSTIRELDLYQQVVRPWRPDVIVLAYFLGNDLAEVVEESNERELAGWHPPGVVRRAAYGCLPNLYLELAMRKQAMQDRQQRGQRTARDVVAAVREAASNRGRDPGLAEQHYLALPLEIRRDVESGLLQPWRVFHGCFEPERFRDAIDPGDPFFERAWPRTTSHLERFLAVAAQDQARFVLAILPAGCQVDQAVADYDRLLGYDVAQEWLHRPGRTQQALATWCREQSVPCLDLTNTFRNSRQPLYYPLDGHFNPAGQDKAAQELAAFLLAQ